MAQNLPINQVVDVKITKEGVAPQGANFNNLLVVGLPSNPENPAIPKSERIRSYSSINEVGANFPVTSLVYEACSTYFGQAPSPDVVLVTLRYGSSGVAPIGYSKAIGESIDFSLDRWRAITNGAFSFTYNDLEITLQNLNFSDVMGVDDVVDLINGHFNNLQPGNQNVSVSSRAAMVADNVWVTTSDEPWTDKGGNYWITHIEPTGELTINYDATFKKFYLFSSAKGRDFIPGSIGPAATGVDISGDTLLGLQESQVYLSQLSASYNLVESSAPITLTYAKAKLIKDGSFALKGMNIMDTVEIFNIDLTRIFESTFTPELAAVLTSHVSYGLGQEVDVNVIENAGGANILVIQALAQSISKVSFLKATMGTDLTAGLWGSKAPVDVEGFIETPSEAIVESARLAGSGTIPGFYGIMVTRTPGLDIDEIGSEILQTAATVQGMTKMYFANLYDQRIYSSSALDIVSKLAAKNFERTVPCALYTAADGNFDSAAAGLLLTQIPGSSTLFGKTPQGPTASSASSNQQMIALNKNANVISVIGGVTIIRNGTVSSTSREYADVIRGIDWLTNEIEVDVFARLASARKIPYTDTGVNILKGEVKKALDLAVLNGLIADDLDEKGNLVPAYSISAVRVADVPEAQRANRIAPTIYFEARLAGAIQKVNVIGTVSV